LLIIGRIIAEKKVVISVFVDMIVKDVADD
jgi:hypothetical protein